MNDIAIEWMRSSFCLDGACLEVADLGDGLVAVRDTKNPDYYLTLTREGWNEFVEEVAMGAWRG